MRLYFENAGYPFLEDAIALMSQYPHVYADLSTITWIIPRAAFYRYLRALVDAGLSSRLMFLSDEIEWPEVIGRGIQAIESAPFFDGTTEARHPVQQCRVVSPARRDDASLSLRDAVGIVHSAV